MAKFEIPYYHDYISPKLASHLLASAKNVPGVSDLKQVGPNQGLETPEALKFLADLYSATKSELAKVLNQRIRDRKFIDERVKACFELNSKLRHDFLSEEYQTVLGLEDSDGRIVFGPKSVNYCNSTAAQPIAPIPDFMQGPHVTLFGPPGTAKMAINAMNTYHRKIKNEPAIVGKLLETHEGSPKWGADDEDSKTPLRDDLVTSSVNLTKCFEGELSYFDPDNGKTYSLEKENLAAPIKRFPGLALPCTFLFYQNSPIPLHLYDFALHLFHNWKMRESLVFYVPKLENEEEAAYIHTMVSVAERMICTLHPEYVPGSVRLMIVLENPRAILRTHEIIDALHPYFIGASLGWHDYLGSTARLFKEDGNYRIPVKADPDIVIKYIKASHNLLADVVGSRGGIKVGGMYGILPLNNDRDSESFQVTMKGFIKDVITQMKRNLTGFWVAHPDFVRLGMALVEAWKTHSNGQSEPLFQLIRELLHEKYHSEVVNFVLGPDIVGIEKSNPNYVRSLIVADIKESDFIANNHPDEIRYNVFQSLQYITDWLCGNGCVALPAHVHGVAVRVMDDLATAERSRWEVWHELYHNRFDLDDFLKIVFEEYQFIRKDLSDEQKIVQVKWNADTEKWYPVALKIMLQLMTDRNPPEFATELLLPFTLSDVRAAADPLAALREIDANKIRLSGYIERFIYHFEICGNKMFAAEMARGPLVDVESAAQIIAKFNLNDIVEAAQFHGNIGESKATLDHFAAKEQALVFSENERLRSELRTLGEEYKSHFGMKFLISAQGKSATELLEALKSRRRNSLEREIENAKEALWQISKKRYGEKPLNGLSEKINNLKSKYSIKDVSLSVSSRGRLQQKEILVSSGENKHFEIASLSKTFAAAFALDYFAAKGISPTTCVNELLSASGSPFRINHPKWGNSVQIKHLLSHSAFNMHYVNGIELGKKMPTALQLLTEPEKFGYKPLEVICEPGSEFHYSGGGFIVLEHLIEALENKSITEVSSSFLNKVSSGRVTFNVENESERNYAHGFFDNDSVVAGTRLMFPAFAAGALGTAAGVHEFLLHLQNAYHDAGYRAISHDTACLMLQGYDKGCRKFMGCDMGLGVFVAECGDNKIAIHQGANEGFRALFLHCVSGPNQGDGFVILCNADNKGVLFIAELAQELLRALEFQGVDFNKFRSEFDARNLRQEEIVNLGYKELVFSAFAPTLPDEIINKGPRSQLAEYNAAVGAQVTSVSNQKFARAENLFSPFEPIFEPDLFCSQGKVMDSWETARHNPYGVESLAFEIIKPTPIKFVSFSTKYHDGNQAEHVRLLAKSPDMTDWVEVVPKIRMNGHSYLNLRLNNLTQPFKVFKVEMYPDGGLSRLGLFAELPESAASDFQSLEVAESRRFAEKIPKTHKPLSLHYAVNPQRIERNRRVFREQGAKIDLVCSAFGGEIVSASNEHYGPAVQVISPFPPIHMFDGLESARSREPGHFEQVIIRLAETSQIRTIIFDFKFFVNNNPSSVSIDALSENGNWISVVDKTEVKAFAGNKKIFALNHSEKFSQLKIKTWPDGGVNRIEVY